MGSAILEVPKADGRREGALAVCQRRPQRSRSPRVSKAGERRRCGEANLVARVFEQGGDRVRAPERFEVTEALCAQEANLGILVRQRARDGSGVLGAQERERPYGRKAHVRPRVGQQRRNVEGGVLGVDPAECQYGRLPGWRVPVLESRLQRGPRITGFQHSERLERRGPDLALRIAAERAHTL